ncbi:MAG: hypothetical protein QMC79_08430 [Anaerosomatales bacterium]|nr:hypothetical protein [Anaerosomatales bacterium]
MRRIAIAGVISGALVLASILLMSAVDTGLTRLLAFVFLQFPAMLIGYVTGGEANTYALAIVAWVLWSVIMYAALWFIGTFVGGLRATDRTVGHA